MGDKNLTLFALHTHGDNQFGPSTISGVGSEDQSEDESAGNSWFGGGSAEAESEPESAESEEEGGGLAGLVVALVVLVAVAVAVKKLTGGSEEVEVAESDDL